VNKATCNVERQPRDDPNNKQEYCQNQEDEISHALLRSIDGVEKGRKRIANILVAVATQRGRPAGLVFEEFLWLLR
jgi:hypothetical protein